MVSDFRKIFFYRQIKGCGIKDEAAERSHIIPGGLHVYIFTDRRCGIRCLGVRDRE